MLPNSPLRGFTLIELLVVVAIVAILAMIAYPSYQDQIRKARRADAQSVLMQAAEFMERVYSESGCYNPGPDNNCIAPNDDAAAPAIPYNKSPIDGGDNFYGVGITAVGDNTYTVRAAPTAGTSQEGTGLLEVNYLGQKFWDEDASCAENLADACVFADGEADWDRG